MIRNFHFVQTNGCRVSVRVDGSAPDFFRLAVDLREAIAERRIRAGGFRLRADLARPIRNPEVMREWIGEEGRDG